jgi:hypothetical protein
VEEWRKSMNPKLLDDIYNAFDPFRPLPPGDPFYVDCHAVRGNDDILRELGKKIAHRTNPLAKFILGIAESGSQPNCCD